jgi:predicted acyl esterase
MYNPEHELDVLQFLDYYLKGVKNGWTLTTRERAAVTDAGGVDKFMSFSDYPVPSTRYETYYLDGSNSSLSTTPVGTTSAVSYNSTAGEANFSITITEEMALVGFFKVLLFVEANGSDDMDLFLVAQKLDANGSVLDAEPDCIESEKLNAYQVQTGWLAALVVDCEFYFAHWMTVSQPRSCQCSHLRTRRN